MSRIHHHTDRDRADHTAQAIDDIPVNWHEDEAHHTANGSTKRIPAGSILFTIVRTEHVPLSTCRGDPRDGRTFGQLIDERIGLAIDSGQIIQSVALEITDAMWSRMVETFNDPGSTFNVEPTSIAKVER